MTLAADPIAKPAAGSNVTIATVVAAMLLYPFALQIFRAVTLAAIAPGAPLQRAAAWAGTVLFLLLAFALPVLGFVVARANSSEPLTEASLFRRRVAHLAFATPSLYVAAGAYRGLLKLRTQEMILWAVLWLAVAAMLLWRAPRRARPASLPAAPTWLPFVHGCVAAALVATFLAAHLANHLSALLGSDVQRAVMDALRLWYRSPYVQPVLVAGLLFMMASGLVLARRATAVRTGVFGTVQTLTGAYLAAFLLSHLTSAFSARSRGIDTDWSWATAAPEGLIAGYVRLVPHYSLGVACLLAHLGCGLRLVLLQHGVAQRVADRIAWTVIAGGALLAISILAGMLGLRL